MKLYSPDKSLLIEVRALTPCHDGLLVEGKIMGAMPMKAVLRPGELRAGLKFASLAVLRRTLRMLLTGR